MKNYESFLFIIDLYKLGRLSRKDLIRNWDFRQKVFNIKPVDLRKATA